ncbi:MAG: RdgB/HAM1 family non-canonical purine NTP pyrophosphatase [bacterium]|nr:RdgB/HAM1 family non-canonical purine NTP pyrophosphatase [bacterium]
MKIILATSNLDKVKEFNRILKDFDVDIKPAPYSIKVAETGKDFIENAILKARAYYREFKVPVLSDDSGLEVDVLGKAPGIFSARFSEDGSYKSNIERLLNQIKDIREEKLRARFVCAVCLIDDRDILHVTQEICEGYIIKEIRGDNGFGYDPIFYYPDLGRTFGEISAEEKDKVSHRGRALRKLFSAILLGV